MWGMLGHPELKPGVRRTHASRVRLRMTLEIVGEGRRKQRR
jgi:hypothetical protein